MAELTRETFIEIQTRLAQEATDRENRRIQEINESNSRLAKNLVDLGTKLEKAIEYLFPSGRKKKKEEK